MGYYNSIPGFSKLSETDHIKLKIVQPDIACWVQEASFEQGETDSGPDMIPVLLGIAMKLGRM